MRSTWRISAVCAVLLLAPPLVSAQHAVAPAGEPAAHAAAGGHDEEQKPALLQFDPGAMIWSILVFALLMLLLRATAWKPILRVLQQREEFITGSIAEAKLQREQAERLLAEYQVQLDKARQEASAIVAEGRRDAEAVRQHIREDAQKEGDQMITRARREIQLAADTARKELHDEVSELAVRVAARIIRKELSSADHKNLVAESLQEMRTRGKAKLN